MKKKITVLVLLLVLLTGSFYLRAASAGHDSEFKATITAYVYSKSNGGVYYVDGVATRFDFVHPDVTEKDGIYVSCADFNRGNVIYDVDFYMKKEGGRYRVIKEVLHKVDGDVVNRLLWQVK